MSKERLDLQIIRIIISIFPVAFLIAYSQIIVKYRVSKLNYDLFQKSDIWIKVYTYFSDAWIVSGYISAFLGSILWLFIVTKYQLVTAFPIYIGITFVLVLFGGAFFLNESVSIAKIVAAILIIVGIALAMSN